jgi:hypothetical protein
MGIQMFERKQSLANQVVMQVGWAPTQLPSSVCIHKNIHEKCLLHFGRHLT